MIYVARKMFPYKNELMHAGDWGVRDYTFAYVVITEHATQGISNYVDAIVRLRSDYAKNTPPLMMRG